jgi:hypothetical protein
MFSAPIKYRVIKITCSNFVVVLRAMKHIIIYPVSNTCSKVIALRLTV